MKFIIKDFKKSETKKEHAERHIRQLNKLLEKYPNDENYLKYKQMYEKQLENEK